jgi:hypothetical protein
MAEEIAIPNFGEANFFGVASKPGLVIVQLVIGNGDVVQFCIEATTLKDLAALFFAQAKIALGEFDASCVEAPGGLN